MQCLYLVDMGYMYALYHIGFQSGVRGPPGVLEGVPGGHQLSTQKDPYEYATQSVQMEPNGPEQVHLYTSQS